MSEAAEQLAPPKRKRGRPPGARDSKPRVRRSRNAVAAEPKPARKVRESDHQIALMKWLDTVPAPNMGGPKLGHFAFAVPNGVWVPAPIDLRMRIIITMRRQGLKKGVPDVWIMLPLHGWHGCIIELKRDERSQIAPEQIEWLDRLRGAGYFVELARGIQEATAAVNRYLAGEQPAPFEWVDDVHGQTN